MQLPPKTLKKSSFRSPKNVLERAAKLIDEERFFYRKALDNNIANLSRSGSINKTLIAVVINVSLMLIAFTSNLMSVTTWLRLVTNFFEIAWLIKYRKLKLLLRLVVQ